MSILHRTLAANFLGLIDTTAPYIFFNSGAFSGPHAAAARNAVQELNVRLSIGDFPTESEGLRTFFMGYQGPLGSLMYLAASTPGALATAEINPDQILNSEKFFVQLAKGPMGDQIAKRMAEAIDAMKGPLFLALLKVIGNEPLNERLLTYLLMLAAPAVSPQPLEPLVFIPIDRRGNPIPDQALARSTGLISNGFATLRKNTDGSTVHVQRDITGPEIYAEAKQRWLALSVPRPLALAAESFDMAAIEAGYPD